MKKELINKTFGKISTIVMYKYIDSDSKFHYLYSPSDSSSAEGTNPENYVPDKILYHGSTKNIDNVDFSEYNFKYIIEKTKYNNINLVNYLDTKTKEISGNSVDDLEKVVSNMFPSSVEESEDRSIGYFGTLTTATKTLYVLDIDEGYYMVEFYEDVIYSNNKYDNEDNHKFLSYEFGELLHLENKWTKPAFRIWFGPSSKTCGNVLDWYYEGDNNLSIIKSEEEKPVPVYPIDWDYFDSDEYSKLLDERLRKKALIVAMTPAIDNAIEKETCVDLNLSYEAWAGNENANRNKNKFNLRNDEYYGVRDNFDIISQIPNSNISKDVRSGSLVATSRLYPYQYPILSRKILSAQENSKYYSPKIVYKKNDEVVFGRKGQNSNEELTWISLSDNNVGNNPYLSSSWILKEYTTNFYTDRVKVLSAYDGGSGLKIDNKSTISPGGLLNIDKNNSKVTFKIYPENGYICDGDKMYIMSNTGSLTLLTGLSGVTIENFDDYHTEITIAPTSTCVVSGETVSVWSAILDSFAKAIIFEISIKTDNVKFITTLDDNIVTDNRVNSLVKYMLLRDQKEIASTKDDVIKLARLGDTLQLTTSNTEEDPRFSNSSLYNFKGIYLSYVDSGKTKKEELEGEGTGPWIFSKDVTSTKMEFNIKYITKCNVSVINYHGFEMGSTTLDVNSGENYKLGIECKLPKFKKVTINIIPFNNALSPFSKEVEISYDGVVKYFDTELNGKKIGYLLTKYGKNYLLTITNVQGCNIVVDFNQD